MSIVVGVDAGGTSTTIVAADGDTVVGEFVGGPANLRIAGVDAAADTISRAIGSALSGMQPSAVFVGASGAGREELAKTLQRALQIRLPASTIGVSDDARIALRAPVPHGDGMVLIAGTGSIAYAEVGETPYRCGGYGYLVGDEGSAFAIGCAAARLTARSYDGRSPRDSLIEAIEKTLRISDAQSLLAHVYDGEQPVRTLASLAPLVLQAAADGERSAMKIVQAAALDLFELVRVLAKNAQLVEREFPLVFAGGLFAENSLLSYLLETRIGNELPLAHVIKDAPPAHVGALALARALLAPA